jgi:hypothetical protein
MFELRAPCDVDHLEIEVNLVADVSDDLESPFTEAAVGSVVDGDALRYGYSPRVVVASATRCTASPYDAMRRLIA